MISSYVGVLRKYAVFSGRATRAEYWWFMLTHFIVVMALGVLAGIGASLNPEDEVPSLALPLILYWIGTLLPSLAAVVRRFHDRGHSGWMALLLLIPTIGGIIVLVFMVLPSELGDNRHGPYPHRA